MRLELWQKGKMISSVILNYFRIGGTKKQGYSATVSIYGCFITGFETKLIIIA
jgi:hypothetical protein